MFIYETTKGTYTGRLIGRTANGIIIHTGLRLVHIADVELVLVHR